MATWEYMEVIFAGQRAEGQKVLNELGLRGWELVTVLEESSGPYRVAYLKRQKS